MRTGLFLLAFAPAVAVNACVLPAGAVLRVVLPPGMDASLKPGRVVEGTIERPLYNGACRVLPPGANVRAESDGDGLRVKLTKPGDLPVALNATLLRFAREKHSAAGGKPEPAVRTMLLRVESDRTFEGGEMPLAAGGTIAAGTQARVALRSGLHSKKNRAGEAVEARLLEPLLADGKVLVPAGALVRGTLTEAKRARRLYRAGGLRLSFQSLEVSAGRAVATPLSISAGELSGGARVDGEGGVTGSAVTKTRALINLGIAYATGKILDDVIEESAKGALGAAVAGSAETAARYVGLGAGAAVFLLQRGREVKLEPETELTLTFARAVEISR